MCPLIRMLMIQLRKSGDMYFRKDELFIEILKSYDEKKLLETLDELSDIMRNNN